LPLNAIDPAHARIRPVARCDARLPAEGVIPSVRR